MCTSGTTGTNCEQGDGRATTRQPSFLAGGASGCQSSPCKNDGRCVSGSDNNTFYCECQPGFGGALCTTALASKTGCTPNPCLNGGVCRRDREGDTVCDCRPAYKGRVCGDRVPNACTANPCRQPTGSVCQLDASLSAGYMCRCAAGVTGPTCTGTLQYEKCV
jgi:hypothetical protein